MKYRVEGLVYIGKASNIFCFAWASNESYLHDYYYIENKPRVYLKKMIDENVPVHMELSSTQNGPRLCWGKVRLLPYEKAYVPPEQNQIRLCYFYKWEDVEGGNPYEVQMAALNTTPLYIIVQELTDYGVVCGEASDGGPTKPKDAKTVEVSENGRIQAVLRRLRE